MDIEEMEETPNRPTDITPEELRAIYDQAKREFTDEDAAAYLEMEPGIPFESIIAELEADLRLRKSSN